MQKKTDFYLLKQKSISEGDISSPIISKQNRELLGLKNSWKFYSFS
jgi:hypothetical protein